MKFIYQSVERIPKHLSRGIVYHTEEFELAALLCACGCGHRVMLLVPDSHEVTSDAGLATVRPSIAVCDAPCKAHYVITAGRVEWLPAFSAAMAKSVMQNQIVRHMDRDANRRTWRTCILDALAKAYKKIKLALRM